MDKELKCPSCGVALHLVDDLELQVVPEVVTPDSAPVADANQAQVAPAVEHVPSAETTPDAQA